MPETALQITIPGEAIQPGDARFLETARWMAHEYAAGVATMNDAVRAIQAAGERMTEAFARAEADHRDTYNRFGVEIRYENATTSYPDDATKPLAAIETKMRRNAWRLLVDHLGIKPLMSVAKRTEFDRQLESGTLPEVTEDAIIATVTGLIGRVQDFAAEAAKEVFDILRPARHARGAEYKTNSAFKVGRRVVLSWFCESDYRGSFRVNYQREAHLTALDSVFHLLDGKGPIKDRRAPLVEAINASPTGIGETTYFRFKCHKNRNLHLEMRRLDLVKELNKQGMGEYVLGDE